MKMCPNIWLWKSVNENVGCPRRCSSDSILSVSKLGVSTVGAHGCPRRCSSGDTLVTPTVDAHGCPRGCSSNAIFMCVCVCVCCNSCLVAVLAPAGYESGWVRGLPFPEFNGVAHHLNVYKDAQAHSIISAQWYWDRFPCSCGCGDPVAHSLTFC